jgi:hypothetical protein
MVRHSPKLNKTTSKFELIILPFVANKDANVDDKQYEKVQIQLELTRKVGQFRWRNVRTAEITNVQNSDTMTRRNIKAVASRTWLVMFEKC